MARKKVATQTEPLNLPPATLEEALIAMSAQNEDMANTVFSICLGVSESIINSMPLENRISDFVTAMDSGDSAFIERFELFAKAWAVVSKDD
jgi:hypothetical protein